MTWLDALHVVGWVSAVVGVALIYWGFVLLIDWAVRSGAQSGANRLPTVRIKARKRVTHCTESCTCCNAYPSHPCPWHERPAYEQYRVELEQRHALSAAVKAGVH